MSDRAAATKPAANAMAVTPSDSADLGTPVRGLYIGGAGDLKVKMDEGEQVVTFVAVPAGSLLPISVDRVYATDTTATNIIALW